MNYKLHNSDCLDVLPNLPDGSVHLTVTSPPYNLNKVASGGGSSKRNYEGWYPDDLPEAEYQTQQRAVVSALRKKNVRFSLLQSSHPLRLAFT